MSETDNGKHSPISLFIVARNELALTQPHPQNTHETTSTSLILHAFDTHTSLSP